MTQENADIQPQAEPHIVKSHDIHIDADYAEWIADIKSRYRSAQVKAAVKVNAEKLLFNWQLGRDLVQKKAEERWGAGVVEQVSLDLKREFPDADGFSTSNLWYMKKWYLFYAEGDAEEKLQRAVGELQSSVNQAVIKKAFRNDPKRSKVVPKEQNELLQRIKEVPSISRAALSKKLNISERQVRKIIDRLKEDGVLTRQGGNLVSWIVNKE